MALNIARSSLFLSYNAFGFPATICALRRLWGPLNYYSVAWVTSLACSFLAILVERTSRRTQLAVYVSNVATESMLTSYSSWLPFVPYGETTLFACVSAVLMGMYKNKVQWNSAIVNSNNVILVE